jgi:predicted nucleotidyltransferase
MTDDLVARLQDGAARAFAGTSVRFAYLFGSRAIDAARPDSDVDVAVRLGGDHDAGEDLQTRLRLAGLLGAAARVADVDLVVLDHAPLPLVGRVLTSRIVIYSVDEPARGANSRAPAARVSRLPDHGRAARPSPARRDRSGPPLMVDVGRLRAIPERVEVDLERLRELAALDTYELGDLDAVKYRFVIARFRDLLVHRYAEVDDEQVIEVLTTRLGDLEAVRAALAAAAR